MYIVSILLAVSLQVAWFGGLSRIAGKRPIGSPTVDGRDRHVKSGR
jgi:hypothetical protein